MTISRDQASSQHEFVLNDTQPPTRSNSQQSVARDARIKTACAECKRRKTKCDGTHPCYSCRWYKQPERCVYTFSRPALVLSRKNFDSVRQRLESATDIIAKLFPSPSIEALNELSREELLHMLGSSSEVEGSRYDPVQASLYLTPEKNSIPADTTPPIGNPPQPMTQEPALKSQADGHGMDEEAQDNISEGDDVNALSATTGQPSSYVGPSSTMQMFRTILRIAPEPKNQQFSSQSPATSQRGGSVRSPENSYKSPSAIQVTERVGILIDAYFNWIHPATPIIHEEEFRKTAFSQTRNDPPWLCLFNMVLALGSIGSTRTDSKEHSTYYHAAKSHLDLEGLGNKSPETLQALILMAGWYNHYRNRPNLASALLGAAFRMAYALGLHKETLHSSESVDHRELRRQIWWNLVVFDAAEAVTLGRTLDTKVFDTEVQCPQDIPTSTMDVPSIASALIVTIGFSRIMTEIQSRLMSPNALPFTESLSLDAHLVDWCEALPGYFHSLTGLTNPGALDPVLKKYVQPFSTIKWRYLNLRMLLYRPSLMEAVLRRIPFAGLTSDQRLCIRKCLTLSGETVDSVKTRVSEPANQYIAWPSTWWLLQICMVPLLSLYVFREPSDEVTHQHQSMQQMSFNRPGSARDQVRQIRDECHRQVQITLRLMKEMEPWAVASGKMHGLISHLYEARNQHLRVWNNMEDSPVLVLGSPENAQMPQAEQPSSSKALKVVPATVQTKTASLSTENIQLEYPAVFPNQLTPNTIGQSHYGGEPQSDMSMNQFEQFSQNWSTYNNNFTWPNATLESLFDLPDEFQYMRNQDPFGFG